MYHVINATSHDAHVAFFEDEAVAIVTRDNIDAAMIVSDQEATSFYHKNVLSTFIVH
jgi:hypothetical protein